MPAASFHLALTRASLRAILRDLGRSTATARGSPGLPATPDAEWLPLPQAAQRLGVSVRTLRRRITAGTLEARRVPTPWGPAWEVRVAAPAPPEAPEGTTPTPSYRSLLERARGLVTENARLTAELAAARAELRRLRERTCP